MFPFSEVTSDNVSGFELYVHIAREMLTSWSKPREGGLRCAQTEARDVQGAAVGAAFVQPGEHEGVDLVAVFLHEGQHTEAWSDYY